MDTSVRDAANKTDAKRMRRTDIVDPQKIIPRDFTISLWNCEFEGVAGKGEGGLTEFRCELLNLYGEVGRPSFIQKATPCPLEKKQSRPFRTWRSYFARKWHVFRNRYERKIGNSFRWTKSKIIHLNLRNTVEET